ncbi:TatD DNase [Basidiobolus ranarum]|uniref:TatD DNase n=1 Tax=Basidiobolus ranarum TaxID=34480 RepID=A0ABR2W911_9FUNG
MFRGDYRGKIAHEDDLEYVLKRALDVGVERMMITGGSLSESKEALELARSKDYLFSTVGCHPTRCSEFEDTSIKASPEAYYEELLEIARSEHTKVVAIGECGLDYDRLHFCDKETQIKYFEKQFQLAETTKLPMFLHNRNTDGDFVDILFYME